MWCRRWCSRASPTPARSSSKVLPLCMVVTYKQTHFAFLLMIPHLLVQGGSAGGFTVLNALVSGSVFAAGASYYGVADMLSLASDTHDFESRYLDSLLGPLPQSRDTYIARSPLTHVGKMTAALILFQGSEDKVRPPPSPLSSIALRRGDCVAGRAALPKRNHPRRVSSQRPQVQVSSRPFLPHVSPCT